MRCASSASPGWSYRHSSTPVACSEKRAKFVPSPSHVAPSGYGVPGQTRRLAMPTAQDEERLRLGGDRAACRGDGSRPAEADIGGVDQNGPVARERDVQEARLVSEVKAHAHSLACRVAPEHPHDG